MACSYRCRSGSSHPWPAWFSSKTSPSGVLTVSSAPDSERRTPLRCSSCSVSFFRLVSFYPSGCMERRLGSLSPVFPPSFSLESSSLRGQWMGRWNGPSPSGCSFFQLWGCPASAVAVAGIRGSDGVGEWFGVFLAMFWLLLAPRS